MFYPVLFSLFYEVLQQLYILKRGNGTENI